MADGTIIDVISFETGGLEMVTLVGAAHTIETSPGPSSSKETYYAEVKNHATGGDAYIQSTREITIGTDWITFGFKVHFPFDDDGSMVFANLRDGLLGGGYLGMSTANGGADMTILGHTISNVFTTDTEYRIEVQWKKHASSPLRVWIDGDLKLEITVNMSTFQKAVIQLWDVANPIFNMIIYFGTSYLMSHPSSIADIDDVTPLGNWTSFGGDWSHTSDVTTPDPLDAGAWTNTDSTPADTNTNIGTDGAGYSLTSGEEFTGAYANAGPNGESKVDNELVGCAWVWTYQTYGLNKSGFSKPIFAPRYGSNATAATDGTVTDSYGSQVTGKRNIVVVQDKTGSQFPGDDDYMQIGYSAIRSPFEADGNVDFWEGWTIVLHKEAVVTTKRVSNGALYNIIREVLSA